MRTGTPSGWWKSTRTEDTKQKVIAFGGIRIIGDETEKVTAARLLGNRYNPNQDETLQKKIDKGLHRMLILCLEIEHLTGKEAIELTKKNR